MLFLTIGLTENTAQIMPYPNNEGVKFEQDNNLTRHKSLYGLYSFSRKGINKSVYELEFQNIAQNDFEIVKNYAFSNRQLFCYYGDSNQNVILRGFYFVELVAVSSTKALETAIRYNFTLRFYEI